MSEKMYRVWFDDPSGVRRHIDVPRNKGIDYVAQGLWLTADWSFGNMEDEIHWLPPSRLVLVTLLPAELT